MKKSLLSVALVVAGIAPTPSHALFTNGGFEDGNFDGWSVRWGKTRSGGTYGNWAAEVTWRGHIAWDGLTDGNPKSPSYPLKAAVLDTTAQRNPYHPAYGDVEAGKYQLILNYDPTHAGYNDTWLQGEYDVTEFRQKGRIEISDVSTLNGITGYRVFAYWKTLMEDPSGHAAADRPSFFAQLSVKKPGETSWSIVRSEFHSADQGAVNGWSKVVKTRSGEPIYRKDTTYVVDVEVNDSVQIDIAVIDCGLSGHGAVSFLDQVGSQPPTPPVDSSHFIGDPCLFASNNLSVGDRSSFHGNVGAGGHIWLGTDVVQTGRIYGDSLQLADRDSVAGDIFYRSALSLGNQFTHAGAVTKDSLLQFPVIPVRVVVPGTEFKGVWWGTDTIKPGSYGTLMATGNVVLTAGTYQFQSIALYSGATLTLDNSAGPILIQSQGDITLDNIQVTMTDTKSSPDMLSRSIDWYSNGNITLYAGGQPIVGRFEAPNGTATIANRPIQGYLHARDVLMYADTRLTCTDSQ